MQRENICYFGSITGRVIASQASEAMEMKCMIAGLLSSWSNLWTASGSESLHWSAELPVTPAMPKVHTMYNAHCVPDVYVIDRIDSAKSIRFCNKFKPSVTVGFQPTKLCTTQYISKCITVIDDGVRWLFDEAINGIRAMEKVQWHIINANYLETLNRTEIFAKICKLNGSFATNVNK